MERVKSILDPVVTFLYKFKDIYGFVSVGLAIAIAFFGITAGPLGSIQLLGLLWVALFALYVEKSWQLRQLQAPKVKVQLKEVRYKLLGPGRQTWVYDHEHVRKGSRLSLLLIFEITPVQVPEITLRFSVNEVKSGGILLTGAPDVVAYFGNQYRYGVEIGPLATINSYQKDAGVLCTFNLYTDSMQELMRMIGSATDMECLLLVEQLDVVGETLRIQVTGKAEQLKRTAREELLEKFPLTAQSKRLLVEYIELLGGNAPESEA